MDSIDINLTDSINGLKTYVDSKLPNEEAHDDKLEALKNLLLGEIAKVKEEIKEITNDIQDDLNYMNQNKADKTELTKTEYRVNVNIQNLDDELAKLKNKISEYII